MKLQINPSDIKEIFEEQMPHLDFTLTTDGTYYVDIITAAHYAGFFAAVKWSVDIANSLSDEEFMANAHMMTAQVNDAC